MVPRIFVFAALVLTELSTASIALQSPYDAASEHPANRVFRAIYRVELIPATISAALPGEHGDDADFYRADWYFASREGEEADRALFGADGRQMPREGFNAEAAAALTADVQAIDGEVLAALRGEPRLAVYLQSDLLRLARRLLDTKQNAELLPTLHAAAMRLALPATALRDPALSTFALDQLAPHLIEMTPAALVELDRRSTRLFDAQFTQLWSSLYLAVPSDREYTTQSLLAAAASAKRESLPHVPLGTTAAMALGIVALDDEGVPRATDLVIDVRVQRFANRDELNADNRTTTRDGVDFLQWLLPRQRVRELAAKPIGLGAFRAVPMDSEELFRDYGSLKHTTYAAQCSLCHRRTNTPEGELAGFSVLRAGARPRVVAAPDTRKRLAEEQMARFVAELAAAR